jgi:hypothetical protein
MTDLTGDGPIRMERRVVQLTTKWEDRSRHEAALTVLIHYPIIHLNLGILVTTAWRAHDTCPLPLQVRILHTVVTTP